MSEARRRRRATFAATIVGMLVAGCAAVRPPAPASAPTATPRPTPSPAPAPTAARRNVVLIGDSTTFGTPEPRPGVRGAIQSPYSPGATLEVLLAHVEPLPDAGGTAWRGARVHDLGVGASTTEHWLSYPTAGCGTLLEFFPVVKAACREKVAWVDAVSPAIGEAPIDAVIVDLGLNDLLITQDPAATVSRLLRIRKALAPVPVVFFPPIAPPEGPRGDWPQRVRAAMVKRKLFEEPQYPAYVPTFDDLHPTDGGYAAKAALWLDALRKLP